MPQTIIIIPCFNEADRLSEDSFLMLIEQPGLELLFVDDGSTDHTRGRLTQIVARSKGRAKLLSLDRNYGKAEAVRHGLLCAVEGNPDSVGFIDADLSTPVSEVVRLIEALHVQGAKVVMGSRVLTLGTDIQRLPLRHYLGRVFATCASLALNLKVYDTQCGAKIFRVTPELKEALRQPFKSRWAFDVEFIARLLFPLTGNGYRVADVIEMPLRRWHHVSGSKITIFQGIRAFFDLIAIGRQVRRKHGSF